MRQGEQRTLVLPSPPKPERFQFTLRHLLIGNTVLAVMLALMQFMAPDWMAGLLGLAALVASLLVAIYQPSHPQAYAITWMLLATYVVAAIVALFRSS
jgi:hypothetical protein